MTLSYWQGRHSVASFESSSDVLILGGGYLGLSIGYWISELRPDLKVTLIERSFCGSGASGRNAGFLTIGSCSFYKSLSEKWGRDKAIEIQRFAQESLQLVRSAFSSRVKFECTASNTLFQTSDSHSKWSGQNFQPEDFGFSWNSTENLPSGLQQSFFGAYEYKDEYKIHPLQLLDALKREVLRRNVKIVENLSGVSVQADGIQTEAHRFKAKKLILALNGYLPQFHDLFAEFITPRRAQMLAVELKDDFNCPSLYYDPLERVYWRKGPGRALLIGGKRLLDEEREVGEFDKVSTIIQNGLEGYLRDRLKVEFDVINRWSGTMGFTEHELPLISRVDAPIDTIVVGGFSGHGMGLGFRAAQEAAKLVLGEVSFSFFDQFKKINISL